MTTYQKQILIALRLNGCERTADALEAYVSHCPASIPDQGRSTELKHPTVPLAERLEIAECLRNGHKWQF